MDGAGWGCDELGIDCFWLAEFHFRPHTPLSAPLVVGSTIAARTKRIKVGLGVQLLPLANPLRLAEECATLDHLSGGRLVYGIGRSSFVDSYQGYGIDYEESRPMFFEALEVMRRAWGVEPFSYEGQYYHFQNVNVIPKPYQQPHPPIRIACEARSSFPIMGKLGFARSSSATRWRCRRCSCCCRSTRRSATRPASSARTT